ncbi:MAG: efflux RND transporter periplasmic adaptor subunit [Flavobacteriales bacterium]
MKQTILLMTMMALLAACGGGHDTSALGKKRAERDSLKAAYADLGVKIKEVEEWLAENDTTVKRNLPTVTTLSLKQGPYAHYVDVHGNVKADRSAALYALGGGRVRSILVKAGDRVRTGQLLVSIDSDVIQKQIAQAETGYELAKTAFEKQQRLWDQKIGSEMQYLQVKSQKEQAEAGVAALREQLRLTNVTAPFDGTVDDVMVRVGDMAAPGVPVARVVDLSGVQLEADVPEVYLKSMKSGAPVKVSFPSVGEAFDAKLDHVGEYIDPANRTFKITVRVPKGEAYMRPNLLSDLSILDASSDSAWVVPSRTVLEDVEGNSYVFALTPTRNDEAKARKVKVKRLSEYKGNTNIVPIDANGLRNGDLVVDEGAKNVSDGQAVRIGHTHNN